MERKKLKKLMACLMTGIMFTTLGNGSVTFAEESIKKAKQRVSVHDPSIVKYENTYYAFGSHIDAAKSTDLQNWTSFTNGYTTPNNALFGDLSKNLAESFAWAGEDDGDCKGGHSVWAPTVFWNKDYKNEDGTTGAFMMYYCTSSTYKRSAIGFAVSQNIEGPYNYVDTVMYSGFQNVHGSDHPNSTKDIYYENTHIDELIDEGVIKDGLNSKWFNGDGTYNTAYAPNAIDPELFYDTEGKLWMTYGSWSGGIYILEVNEETGELIYPGVDSDVDSVNFTDRYFGKRISGGYTKSGEGADVVYDAETGYYYLTVTYGGLTANGGYNMRLFRSKNPDGPYLDAAGNNAALPGNVANEGYGIKLISNYKFDCQDVALKAAGHNSVLIEDNGNRYLIHHQRFDNGTEYHEIRVHQMFVNEDGWLVVAPYENSGDVISKTGYDMDKIVGNYQFINHGNSNSGSVEETLNVKLNSDYSVTGDLEGTWSMKEGSYYMNITIDGVTYKGVFFEQQDESDYYNKVMTFTAIGDNNKSIWGSRLELNDEEAIEYVSKYLDKTIPKVTKTNIELPNEGPFDTKISWKSENDDVISNTGVVTRGNEDKTVKLIATITRGKAKEEKELNVTVTGKLSEVGVEPTYKYDFELVNEINVSNSGTKDGFATLIGDAKVSVDEERGSVLEINNEKAARKVNYLALPKDTFNGITTDGYTVSMWVNVDKKNPNYFEHSALFEASQTNAAGAPDYPITRISANLFGRINSNGAWADATQVSKPLKGNEWEYVTYTVNEHGVVVYVDGNEVARDNKNLAQCFANNFLALMTDVRIGSGNIWNDSDVASAKFDNVSVYNVALTDKQVEALYNKEIDTDDDNGNNGGDNGNNGGDNGNNKPPVTVNPDNGIVSVEEVKNKDGVNSIVVDSSKSKVIVEITDIEAVKNGKGSFEIKQGNNKIIIPFSLIDKSLLTEGSKIVFTMDAKNDDNLTKGLKAVKKVFEFDLSVVKGNDSIKIHTFKDGVATITLSLSDNDLKGLDKSKLTVFYYNEETKKYESLETTVDGNNVTFKTAHFGKFIVAEKAVSENNTTLPQTGGVNSNFVLVIASLLIIGGVITLGKKRLKV